MPSPPVYPRKYLRHHLVPFLCCHSSPWEAVAGNSPTVAAAEGKEGRAAGNMVPAAAGSTLGSQEGRSRSVVDLSRSIAVVVGLAVAQDRLGQPQSALAEGSLVVHLGFLYGS